MLAGRLNIEYKEHRWSLGDQYDAITIKQVRDDGKVTQGGNSGGNEKCLDLKYNSKENQQYVGQKKKMVSQE